MASLVNTIAAKTPAPVYGPTLGMRPPTTLASAIAIRAATPTPRVTTPLVAPAPFVVPKLQAAPSLGTSVLGIKATPTPAQALATFTNLFGGGGSVASPIPVAPITSTIPVDTGGGGGGGSGSTIPLPLGDIAAAGVTRGAWIVGGVVGAGVLAWLLLRKKGKR